MFAKILLLSDEPALIVVICHWNHRLFANGGRLNVLSSAGDLHSEPHEQVQPGLVGVGVVLQGQATP